MLCNTLVLGIGDKHRVPDVFVFFFSTLFRHAHAGLLLVVVR